MKKWVRRILGAVGLGLIWAAGWAPLGVLLGVIVDPDGSMDEMWGAVGAYPGFICGAVFSALVWIAEGRRRFRELSLRRSGAWGAVAGLLLGVYVLAAGGASSAFASPWPWVVLIVSTTLLSAGSAVGSVLLFRVAVSRGRLLNALDP